MQNDSIEQIRRVVVETVIELMDIGGTTPEITCEVIAENLPQQYKGLGAEKVFSLCKEVHASSEPVESAGLQALFEVFNKRYFDGRLCHFTVLAVYDASHFSGNQSGCGWVDFTNRRIYVQITGTLLGCSMTNYLLVQMAHAAKGTNDWLDERWINEMLRLRLLGAPVADFQARNWRM